MKTIIEKLKKRNKEKYSLWNFGASPSVIKKMEKDLNLKIVDLNDTEIE